MYKLNSQHAILTQMGEYGVIFDVREKEYVTLNETYLLIVNMLNEQKTISDIVNRMTEEYDISKEDCEKEVLECIDELLKLEYLVEV